MNYIWDYLIIGIHRDYNPLEIDFKRAIYCSPYMELSFSDINNRFILNPTEVNPFYRDTYTTMFKYFFEPDFNESKEVIEQLFDIYIHLLFETDRYQGMSRREYYIRFLINDLKNGVYGQKAKKQIYSFNISQQIIIANGLLSLYRTGESVFVLKKILLSIFKSAILYANTREKNELYFYLRVPYSEKDNDKIECIINLFMPFRFSYEIYWDKIFGINELDAYMVQENMVQF